MKTKKIILSFTILATSLSGCAGNKKANDHFEQDNQKYTLSKIIPMELTEFKNIKLQVPDTAGGAPLMQCIQARQSFREFETKNLSLKHLSEILWVASE